MACRGYHSRPIPNLKEIYEISGREERASDKISNERTRIGRDMPKCNVTRQPAQQVPPRAARSNRKGGSRQQQWLWGVFRHRIGLSCLRLSVAEINIHAAKKKANRNVDLPE